MCHDFRGGVGGGRATFGMFSYTGKKEDEKE